MSVQNVGKQLTPQYTENSQFYIIQVSEFPLKIFNVLSAALLHYYWLIFATAASLTHQQSLKSQHKLYRQETQNFILFSKYNGNSLGKSQQQASRELSWAVPWKHSCVHLQNFGAAIDSYKGKCVTGNLDVMQQCLNIGWMSNTVLKINCHAQSLLVLNWQTGQNPKYLITAHHYLEAELTLY